MDMSGSIHEQLVEVLAKLGDRDVAEKHARLIRAAVLAASRGHNIGHEDAGYYARAQRPKSLGPTKELRDLARLASKAIRGKLSQEDWIREWAARPPSVWRACRPFLLERGSRTRSNQTTRFLSTHSWNNRSNVASRTSRARFYDNRSKARSSATSDRSSA
jgi:hypothetical protein